MSIFQACLAFTVQWILMNKHVLVLFINAICSIIQTSHSFYSVFHSSNFQVSIYLLQCILCIESLTKHVLVLSLHIAVFSQHVLTFTMQYNVPASHDLYCTYVQCNIMSHNVLSFIGYYNVQTNLLFGHYNTAVP